MILHYHPCGTRTPATWSQPAPDVLRCEWRGKVYECDLSDPGVEYEIPEEVRDVIHSAWRETEDGPLHVKVPSLWPIHEEVTIDHGSDELIGPSPLFKTLGETYQQIEAQQ